jgi:hypothetical protein
LDSKNEKILCECAWWVGVFAKVQKAPVSFIVSVCVCVSVSVSVCMEHIGSHWMDFHEILYLITFQKSVEKIQLSLQSDKNNRCFASRPKNIYDNCFRQTL